MPNPAELAGQSEFPSTVWSRLVHGAEPRKAAEYLAERYWKPSYCYIRRRWRRSTDDAMDLTQGFFAEALAKDFLAKASPDRGSFRHFLRVSLENFLRNATRDAKALKRGGGVRIVGLGDIAEGEAALGVARKGSAEEIFDREWMETVFDRCLPRLREQYAAEKRPEYFEVFRRYEVDAMTGKRPTYGVLAAELRIAVTDVRNYLTHARGRWHKLVLEEIRETTATREDFEREVRELLGR